MFEIVKKGTGEVFYATAMSAGFDIPANEDVVLAPGQSKVVKTGLFLKEAPKAAYVLELRREDSPYREEFRMVPQLEIRPRSGLAAKKVVTVLNSPGTVDSDYPEEIGVILMNHGTQEFTAKAGERIAQGVVTLAMQVPSVANKSAVRTSGFGSTGSAST